LIIVPLPNLRIRAGKFWGKRSARQSLASSGGAGAAQASEGTGAATGGERALLSPGESASAKGSAPSEGVWEADAGHCSGARRSPTAKARTSVALRQRLHTPPRDAVALMASHPGVVQCPRPNVVRATTSRAESGLPACAMEMWQTVAANLRGRCTQKGQLVLRSSPGGTGVCSPVRCRCAGGGGSASSGGPGCRASPMRRPRKP
jgi:hypothetical protein